jgi:hypothetical protein
MAQENETLISVMPILPSADNQQCHYGVKWVLGALYPGVKGPLRADRSPPSSKGKVVPVLQLSTTP